MAFAIKFQTCTGVPGKDARTDVDFRGGEPADTHQTVFEVDPVDDSLLSKALEFLPLLNAEIAKRIPDGAPEHIEVRVMDSDGKV